LKLLVHEDSLVKGGYSLQMEVPSAAKIVIYLILIHGF